MKTPKEIIKNRVNELGQTQPQEIKDAIEKLALDIYEKGMKPKDAMGLSDQMVEGMYSFGYRLYNTGKYDQASQLFRLLIMLDPMQARFMMGLGACLHMQKKYEDASNAYVLCAVLDLTNPLPHYHAADCYLEDNKLELAVTALQSCIIICGEQPQYSVIKERALVMLQGILAKVDEKYKDPKADKQQANISAA